MTVAVLQAALGDLDRFARLDQVVAYAGMDLQVRQSSKWKGQTKLSKRGSVVIFAASCTWPLCVVFACQPLPLGSTTIV